MAQRGQWILVVVIIGVLGGALVAGMALTPKMESVSPGNRAPDFAALDIASGDSVSLDSYRGKVVLLNIWATWCIPCEVEMPSIQRLYDEFGPMGLAVVAISVDDGSADQVKEWIDERGFTFDVLHDQTGNIERTYQTIGVPESFIIDRQGEIVKKVIGQVEWDHVTHKTLLRRLLSQTQE